MYAWLILHGFVVYNLLHFTWKPLDKVQKLESSVVHLCTRGNGNGLIVWTSCLIVQRLTALHKSPLWNCQKLSDLFCFSFYNLPVLRTLHSCWWWDLMFCFHLSSTSLLILMQLAGRGNKDNKCSIKAVEEMLESMQITMSWCPHLDFTILLLKHVHVLQHGSSVRLLIDTDVFLFHHNSSFSLIFG